MSNSLRFWNAQGGKVESLKIPSLFPLTNEERREIRSLGKIIAYFQTMPYNTEK